MDLRQAALAACRSLCPGILSEYPHMKNLSLPDQSPKEIPRVLACFTI